MVPFGAGHRRCMAGFISNRTADALDQLLRRPDPRAARAGGASVPVSQFVECGTLISSSPQNHYNGTVQYVGGLSGPSDAPGATDGVVLAEIEGGTLTPGRVYLAVQAGTTSAGKPVYWCEHAAAGAAGDAHYLAPVDYAATGPVTLATGLENGDTLDGGTLATGMSILLPYQSTDSENGVYTVNASGAPTRRSDADTSAKLHGAVVPVRFGDTLARSLWVCTAPLQPTSFSGQIWERKGNAVYAVPLASVGSTNPLPMRTGADGPLTAALDDSPGYYTATGFTNGSNGTYEASSL